MQSVEQSCNYSQTRMSQNIEMQIPLDYLSSFQVFSWLLSSSRQRWYSVAICTSTEVTRTPSPPSSAFFSVNSATTSSNRQMPSSVPSSFSASISWWIGSWWTCSYRSWTTYLLKFRRTRGYNRMITRWSISWSTNWKVRQKFGTYSDHTLVHMRSSSFVFVITFHVPFYIECQKYPWSRLPHSLMVVYSLQNVEQPEKSRNKI